MLTKTIDIRKKWENFSYEGAEKRIIFLHHTAGYNVQSSEDWLYKLTLKNFRERKGSIGVNYYIDKDGTIFYAIDENKWAWHSGLGNIEFEKRTISIELDNLGFLREEGNKLYDLYGNEWKIRDKINNKIYAYFNNYIFEFIQLEKEWRGFRIYHAYSEKQIQALIWLLNEIFEQHKIERNIHKDFLPENAYLNSAIYKTFSGIVNHSQFLGIKPNANDYYSKLRSFVKWDLSIVFPVKKLIESLNLRIV